MLVIARVHMEALYTHGDQLSMLSGILSYWKLQKGKQFKLRKWQQTSNYMPELENCHWWRIAVPPIALTS